MGLVMTVRPFLDEAVKTADERWEVCNTHTGLEKTRAILCTPQLAFMQSRAMVTVWMAYRWTIHVLHSGIDEVSSVSLKGLIAAVLVVVASRLVVFFYHELPALTGWARWLLARRTAPKKKGEDGKQRLPAGAPYRLPSSRTAYAS